MTWQGAAGGFEGSIPRCGKPCPRAGLLSAPSPGISHTRPREGPRPAETAEQQASSRLYVPGDVCAPTRPGRPPLPDARLLWAPPPLNTHLPRAHGLHTRGPHVWACGGLACTPRGRLAGGTQQRGAGTQHCPSLPAVLLVARREKGGWDWRPPGAPQGRGHEREPTFPRVRGSRRAPAPAGSPAEGPTLKEAVGEAPASSSRQACDLSSPLQADPLVPAQGAPGAAGSWARAALVSRCHRSPLFRARVGFLATWLLPHGKCCPGLGSSSRWSRQRLRLPPPPGEGWKDQSVWCADPRRPCSGIF